MIAFTRPDNGASVVVNAEHITHFHTSVLPGKATVLYMVNGLVVEVKECINTVAKAIAEDLD